MIFLVWFLPLLNTWGAWYHYFSFNLYSENLADLYVGIDGPSIARLEKETLSYVIETQEEGQASTLNVGLWSFGELKVQLFAI